MVRHLGMSEKVGLRVYPEDKTLGPQTSEMIDAEVTSLLNNAYDRAIKILKSHRFVVSS